jgi:hypothetical protein
MISAGLNIIHDCDETYNYLEPLHFLLGHGSGMQTWEYSAAFALRSYLYLSLHAAAGAPALLLGSARGEIGAGGRLNIRPLYGNGAIQLQQGWVGAAAVHQTAAQRLPACCLPCLALPGYLSPPP